MVTKLAFTVFTTLFALATAIADEGGGVGNGGSGYHCGDQPVVTGEYLLARRFSAPIESTNREEFIARILSKIKNTEFKERLYRQWLAYGDSEFWPEGTLKDTTVYYYLTPTLRSPYSKEGLIASEDPGAEICVTPMYEPVLCCERVLLSFFYPRSKTPTKLAANYNRLSRYQKNLLELHEAVYRVGFDLARLDPPARIDHVETSIDRYQQIAVEDLKGELPSVQVMSLVAHLVGERPAEDLDVDFAINVFWAWTRVTRQR